MIVEKDKGTPEFTPVIVTLTLMSDQEVKMLRKLAGRNLTVASAVVSGEICTDSDKSVLAEMLLSIYRVL